MMPTHSLALDQQLYQQLSEHLNANILQFALKKKKQLKEVLGTQIETALGLLFVWSFV